MRAPACVYLAGDTDNIYFWWYLTFPLYGTLKISVSGQTYTLLLPETLKISFAGDSYTFLLPGTLKVTFAGDTKICFAGDTEIFVCWRH